jgi:hypothetical protein
VLDGAGVVEKERVDGVAVQVDAGEFKIPCFSDRGGLTVGSVHLEVGTPLVHELDVLVKKVAIGSCVEDCEVSVVSDSIGSVRERKGVGSVAAACWVGGIDLW